MSATVTVAPREIHDLVYRSSRAAGCGAGIADRMAENVTFAEIHRGAAVEAFVAALVAGGLSASPLATAPDALAAAEVTARSDGEATVAFDPSVPLAGLAASLWHTLERGVHAVDLDPHATGASAIASIRLSTDHVDTDHANELVGSAIRARSGDAFRNGVVLDRTWFAHLDLAAAEFLVAEATLDEIDQIDHP